MAFADSFERTPDVSRQIARSDKKDALAIAFSALANLKLAVAVLDVTGDVLIGNPRFEKMFAGNVGIATLRLMIEGAADGPFELTLDDSRSFHIETTQLPVGRLVTAEDVTDRLAERVRSAAEDRIDAVTGLGNALAFRERLAAAVATATEANPAAVLILSLDRLREISEPLGCPLGEAVVRTAADRLRAVTGSGAIVARLEGHKFGILHLEYSQPRAAALLAERLADFIGRPYLLDGHLLTVEPHLGIALLPSDGRDPGQILRSADMALSFARRADGGTFRFFETAMEQQIKTRRRLELDLRRALTLREFTLVYQPQFNLASNRITGFESLLRWHSPIHDVVSPATFIPLAEDSGLITALGEWGMHTACREAARWPQPLSIAVNVSAVQVVNPGFLPAIRSALAESRLDPRRLELEITESLLLHDDGAAVDVLRAVRQLGVRVSMDDFGTGYSSLSRLHSFPFDKIKIDQSFVRAGSEDPSGRAIVRAIAALGRSLGIDTTAEGVETEEQLARVIADGCTEVQGYLIGRPLPPDQLSGLSQNTAPQLTPAAA